MRGLRRLLVLTAVAAFAVVGSAAAQSRPTPSDLEDELVCPTCRTTLDQSDAPIARRMKRFIRQRIAAGDSKSEIKRKLVAQFGPGVLAAPERRGFDLLAWVAPLAGLAAAAALVGALAWRWTRERDGEETSAAASTDGRGALDPELERRLDEELAGFDA